jgi:hypothetical protein
MGLGKTLALSVLTLNTTVKINAGQQGGFEELAEVLSKSSHSVQQMILSCIMILNIFTFWELHVKISCINQ